MGFEYKDDRMSQRANLEQGHKAVFYATGEENVLDDIFNGAMILLTGSINVDEAIKKLEEGGKWPQLIAWLKDHSSAHHVSIGTIRYTFWWRYRNGPVSTPWNVKGYKIQGWIAVE